tara:strand:+ start:200 stop:847 length:648 start_codon:yes stop_codon:yes gene_type:complete
MKTDDLIKDLTKDLEPVKPVPSLASRLFLYSALSVLLIRAVAFYIGESRMSMGEMLKPQFFFEMALLFGAGLMAIAAAFKLSIPDTKIRCTTVALLVIPTMIVIGMNIFGYLRITGISMMEEMHKHDTFLHEITDLLLMIALPTAMLFYIIGRAAPTFRMWAGYAIVLSVACFGAIVLRTFCGMDHGAHLIIYHYLPILGASAIGVVMGAISLKW